MGDGESEEKTKEKIRRIIVNNKSELKNEGEEWTKY